MNLHFLPIAACNSPGELNCNFSHSYGYKYFMYLKRKEKKHKLISHRLYVQDR